MTQYLSRAMFGCLALVGCMLSVFPHPTTAWSAAQPSCFVPAMHPGNGQRVCVSATTSSQTLERQVRSFIDTKPAHALKQRNFISAGSEFYSHAKRAPVLTSTSCYQGHRTSSTAFARRNRAEGERGNSTGWQVSSTNDVHARYAVPDDADVASDRNQGDVHWDC
eukprot:3328160-Rhodomonas_salina.2